ncbi:nuclear transport factor 2 family protein [Lactococcus nasutitermitis]|uniref:Nuclear transport factor 2 family protein n=1 Tax=Lactococcus nasutitermitis TaxID=1652957 RepID=A0ABV9JCW5_9LACT|nr:nuclear transport factor 2 family protein [Lactococcus nasutitermitis]
MKKEEIFKSYIRAWLKKDVNLFLTVLSKNITVTECFGAQYQGRTEAEKWFLDWTGAFDNSVKKWEVINSYFDGNIAFFTWTFDYIYKGKSDIFDGISVVTFEDDKIREIKEYEMKHEKFRPYNS